MLTSNDIEKIIPHRHPFLLIDNVIELEAGKKVIAKKCVTVNEWFFVGHFPNKHVMPGVLIVEALAQAGAVAILSLEEFKGKIAYFAGIDKARFKRKVVPGDVLTLEVEIIKMRGILGVAQATAKVNDELAVACELMFSF
ncbi:MAG: 3-hydroxyacyl-ACP dehydratase FabZ [Defluviitaleaceae bacterium]|nr:3-hydroxyacyl-ACP dehydratase FabZ [Defluviitaleaceae bacterium]